MNDFKEGDEAALRIRITDVGMGGPDGEYPDRYPVAQVEFDLVDATAGDWYGSRVRIGEHCEGRGIADAKAVLPLSDVVADAERMAQMEAVLRDEQSALWSDLANAQGNAIHGEWSMQCDWICFRLRSIAQLIGWQPRDDIDPRTNSVYDALTAGELPHAKADPQLTASAR